VEQFREHKPLYDHKPQHIAPRGTNLKGRSNERPF